LEGKKASPTEEEFMVHSTWVTKNSFVDYYQQERKKQCLHHVTIALLLQQIFQLSGENNANNIWLKYYLPVEV